MPSASLVPSPGFPSPVQRNEHLPSTVLPAEGGVSVVAILLNALLELAARVVLHLRVERGRFRGDGGYNRCIKPTTDYGLCWALLRQGHMHEDYILLSQVFALMRSFFVFCFFH